MRNAGEAPQPFFQKKPNADAAIQAKLSVGQPNDKYEQEADAMADKVVQRLSSNAGVSEGNASNDIQAKPLAAAITPLVQRKCSVCEEKEKLQRKEEDNEPLAGDLQKKPIFESNTEAPPDDEKNVQRRCAACEHEEEKGLQKKSDSSAPQPASMSVEAALSSSKGSGSPLPESTRSEMESSFGSDFSQVRIHSGSSAVQMSNDLNAQAFTHGNDIYFNSGKYDTESAQGKHLLAHELTHTVQQGGSQSLVQNSIIQRTTHSGGPTNCKSATLSSRAAGVAAHAQIDTIMLAMGAHPNFIPRGTKALRSVSPPPPGVPYGFADIWKNYPAAIEMAEIKSASAGDTAARRDVNHYVLRHDQWATRTAVPPLDWPDARYLDFIGSVKPAALLDVGRFTGSGVPIGPFVADLSKLLWMEGDATGSVVYWCTPLPDPIWIPVIIIIVEALKAMLEQAKRIMRGIMEGLEEIGEWIGENWVYILIAIAVIAAIALCIFFAAEILAFLALVAAAVVETAAAMSALLGNAFVAWEAMTAVLLILGITLPGNGQAATALQASLRQQIPSTQREAGGGYEAGEDQEGNFHAAGGGGVSAGDQTVAAMRVFAGTLAPMTNPMYLYSAGRSAAGNINEGSIAQVRHAVAILGRMGDPATAGYLNGKINSLNVTG